MSTSSGPRAFATTSPNEGATMSGPRATVIGTGLIGGSIGLALRERGWVVSGVDADESRVERALAIGALDHTGIDPRSDITFVAVPVLSIVDAVQRALAETSGLVTDVGSVKAPIVAALA